MTQPQNLDDVRLERTANDDWEPRGVHLFNDPRFLTWVCVVTTALVVIFGTILGIRGYFNAVVALPWVLVAVSYLVGQRLLRGLQLGIDECKAAAEASTAEMTEKLKLLKSAYHHFLRVMRIDLRAIESDIQLQNSGASASQIKQLTRDEIEKDLNERYATFLPWEKGPKSSFRLAATRFSRAIESLERLQPVLQRRSEMDAIIETSGTPADALKQAANERDKLDGIINQSLYRINGELREIPPLAEQIQNRAFWYLIWWKKLCYFSIILVPLAYVICCRIFSIPY